MKNGKKLVRSLLILAALILAGFLLTPWYHRYIENDHMKTCRKARIRLILQYQAAMKEPGTDAEEALASSLGAPFPADTSLSREGESYIIKGPCLSGGTYHVLIDGDDPMDILISCDHEGHGQVSLGP